MSDFTVSVCTTRQDGWRHEFYKDEAGEWRWRIWAPNGEKTGASTEGYKNYSECEQNFHDVGAYIVRQP